MKVNKPFLQSINAPESFKKLINIPENLTGQQVPHQTCVFTKNIKAVPHIH